MKGLNRAVLDLNRRIDKAICRRELLIALDTLLKIQAAENAHIERVAQIKAERILSIKRELINAITGAIAGITEKG